MISTLRVAPRQPLADDRVVGRPALLGQRHEAVELGAELHRHRGGGLAPLVAEQRHRHRPAAVHLADDVLLRRAGVGEEHLVELRLAGDHLDRAAPRRRAGPSGTSRNEMPLCFGASGSVRVSTKIQLARWPADVQIFWPLMTHSSPSSTARQPRLARSDAGVRLGVALAPAVLAEQDPREVVLLLLLGAPLEDRVADHLDAEHVVGAAGGHAGLGELLGHDHLLERREPGAAVLLGPDSARAAVLVERLRRHSA